MTREDRFSKCFCDESGLSPTTPCVGCPRWGSNKPPEPLIPSQFGSAFEEPDPLLQTVVDLAAFAGRAVDKKLDELANECARELFSEKESEPTEESAPEPERPSLRRIGCEPDAELIDMLEYALKDARSGELRGVVLFGAKIGNNSSSGQAGDVNFGSICAAFEHWKWRHLVICHDEE